MRSTLLLLYAWLALVGVPTRGAQAQDDLGRIAGVVRDDAARPIDDVAIRIVDGRRQTRTDPTGSFSFEGLLPGEYRLRFERIGYAPAESTWVVRAGQQVGLELRLTPLVYSLTPIVVRGRAGGVSGAVFDEAMRPLTGASVDVLASRQRAVTDSAGGFSLGELNPGTYFVVFRRTGYAPVQRAVVVEQGDSREMYVQLDALPPDIPADGVAEASGFKGWKPLAYSDFSSRQVRRDRRAILVSREELWVLGPTSLEAGLASAPSALAQGYQRTELRSAAVYLEGKPSARPLAAFRVPDVEAVEIHPARDGARAQVWIWLR
jgi:hypothetical protein